MQIFIVMIICFLSVYGAIALIENLIVRKKKKLDSGNKVHIIMQVKNQEDNIEGIIRGITWESCAGDIIVVDEGSTDDTQEIMLRLENEFPYLHYMEKEEYIEYIKNGSLA